MEFNREQAIPDDAVTPTPINETTVQSEHSHGIDELQSVSLTFVNDLDVPEVQIQEIQQLDEYETDSDTESDEEGDFEKVGKTCTTRSEGAVRAFVRLDLRGRYYLMVIRLKNCIFFSIALKAKTLMSVPYNAHFWWRFCEFMQYIFILVRSNPQN